ncbi:MAG TPA: neutral/alkaline non-lysosomal ceramidase N-terminal domain-containing protein, partial [Thermoanaerobaculia bacterium]|nr:neutral/alkaline non-lysosomal ceramidase N-terminal domain-containing protein [Thermoanaerobaculia bacterium]
MRFARALSGLLALVSVGAAPVSAELRAGAAKADITPPLGGRMYGYGARGDNVSIGVHDRLYAKALVAAAGGTEVAIVTLDLGSFEKDRVARVKDAVRRQTGIEHVLLIASHTHSAPVYDPAFPSRQAPYHVDAETRIARAVAEARAAMRPARVGVGWGRVEECHNRRQVMADGTVEMRWANRERLPTSPVDTTVGVVAFGTPAGEPIATLVSFACHPVVLGPENLEISADYPGVMMAGVEAAAGGQAMFVQGAAGDINPYWDKTPPAEGGFEQMTKMGEALAAEVIRLRQGLKQSFDVDRLAVATETVPLEPRWNLDDPEVEAAFRRNQFGWIFERYRERFGLERDAEISVLVFGDRLAIGAFPGEFFVEHGLRFKNGSMVRDTLFAGYTNGALGYFPTIRAAAEGGYGATEATIVEVGAGDRLVSRALIHLHRM